MVYFIIYIFLQGPATMRQLFITLLSVLCTLMVANAFAKSTPVKAYQECCGRKNCVDYPLRDVDLWITSERDQVDLRTDHNGVFYTNYKVIDAYLMQAGAILPGCRALPERTNSQEIVLGGPGTICPKEYCNNGQ
jgi:hypothetical protein